MQNKTEFDIDKIDTNISFKTLVKVIIYIIVGVLILLPKVYLRAQIYYTSIEILSSYEKYESLRSDNKELTNEIGAIRFKNSTVDTFFDIK